MQNSNEYILTLLQRNQFDSARYACLERLKIDRIDAQAWVFLGQSMIGLKRGRMAELCFKRAILLDPFATWESDMMGKAHAVSLGLDDNKVLQLLEVPHTTVSACILTRDSHRTIRQCLEALQGAVDEIIVVDTGSTDDTIEIVESFGIKVHHFTWCDDFSAARNFAQSLVSSEWIIVVDSDEILYPDDRDSIRVVAGLFNSKYSTMHVFQMNQINGDISPVTVKRMYTTSQFEWANPIHEQIVQKPTVDFNKEFYSQSVRIRLFHDGYEPSVVDEMRKSDRNLRILRVAIDKDPENYSYQYFLGRELVLSEKLEEGIAYLEQAYLSTKKMDHLPLLPEICNSLHYAYNTMGFPDKAKDAANRLMQDCPDHPNGWFFCGLHAVNASSMIAQDAIHFFTMAKQIAQSFRSSSDYDREIASWKSDYWLAVIAQKTGNLAEAKRLFQHVLNVYPDMTDAADRLLTLDQLLASMQKA